MRWKIRQGEALLWHTWDDDEFLVYDTRTGDTHLVNRVTSEVLRLLQSPRALAELVRLLAEALEVEHTAPFEMNITNLLAHLDRIGLVERNS